MYTELDKHQKVKLRPCFWCQCEEIHVFASHKNQNFVVLQCANCRLETPITTFKAAVERWNSNPITGEMLTAGKVINVIEGWVESQADEESLWPYGIEAEKLKQLLDKIRKAL